MTRLKFNFLKLKRPCENKKNTSNPPWRIKGSKHHTFRMEAFAEVAVYRVAACAVVARLHHRLTCRLLAPGALPERSWCRHTRKRLMRSREICTAGSRGL